MSTGTARIAGEFETKKTLAQQRNLGNRFSWLKQLAKTSYVGMTRLSAYWLAVKCALLLCILPLLVRLFSLPDLLKHITASRNSRSATSVDIDLAVRVVTRLCQLRFFRQPFFPRDCLRQSLVLYRVLSRMGHPVMIHFGVKKQVSAFDGHSWVTLHGKPLGEHIPVGTFRTVYSYPLIAESNWQNAAVFE
jgi:hypothetical protein